MSLDVSLVRKTGMLEGVFDLSGRFGTRPHRIEIYAGNITHNLSVMAKAAGLYNACWRPENLEAKCASDLIPHLQNGLEALKEDPERFGRYNPANGWGNYEGLVLFVEQYLSACIENPDAEIEVSR